MGLLIRSDSTRPDRNPAEVFEMIRGRQSGDQRNVVGSDDEVKLESWCTKSGRIGAVSLTLSPEQKTRMPHLETLVAEYLEWQGEIAALASAEG